MSQAMQTRPLISLCMIVKDEAQNLGRCLKSAAEVADEMIVVDTGSTDHTVEVAEVGGARVFRHRWQNDFAEARNFSLEQATGEWILHLDADEALETETRAQIRPLLARTSADGFGMTQRNFTAANDLVRYDDLRITRLFRNRPEFRYEQAIHEQIRPSIERHGGRVEASDLIIWHYGYTQLTAQGQQSRARRNLELLELALASAPGDAYLHYQVGVTHKSLGNFELAEAHLCQALELDQQTLGANIRGVACMKLAQLAYSAKRYDQAFGYASASLEINPQNTVSLYITALIAMARGDIKQAYSVFCRVRENPDLSSDSLKDVETVIAHLKSLPANAENLLP
jgi:tetratricopeptide (TPR) repeat protein